MERRINKLTLVLIVLLIILFLIWIPTFGTSNNSGAFSFNVDVITITISNNEYIIDDKKRVNEISDYLSSVSWENVQNLQKVYNSCDIWVDFGNNTLVGIDCDLNVALWIGKTHKKNSPMIAYVTKEFVDELTERK